MSRLAALCALCVVLAAAAPARAAGGVGVPPPLRDVRVDEHLGATVPEDAVLHDIDGGTVRLGELIDGHHPVLLTLAYYRCPMLCGLVLGGAARAAAKASHQAGKDYRLVTVGIDPRETPAEARARVDRLHREAPPVPDGAWRFFLTDEATVHRLADAVGFVYRYDARSGQYAHPAVMMVLTPDGRVSRYLYGFDPTSAELDAALDAAASGRIARRSVEQLLLQCFCYTPALRRYAGALRWTLRLAAVAIMLGFLAVTLLGVRAVRRRSAT